MNYRFLIDTAVDTIRKRYDKRHNPVMGDTVCVICAGNGNIYTGKNEYVTKEDCTENVHAEIDALKKMQDDGQTVVKAMTVFNSCNVSPILPCNGCIDYILSLDKENTKTLIITPNGNMFITDVARYAAGTDNMQTRRTESRYSVYMNVPEHNRGASLYMAPPVMPGQGMPASRSMNMSANLSANQPNYSANYQNIPENANSGQPVRPNQNGVNKLLKNKLLNLLDDDDE